MFLNPSQLALVATIPSYTAICTISVDSLTCRVTACITLVFTIKTRGTKITFCRINTDILSCNNKGFCRRLLFQISKLNILFFILIKLGQLKMILITHKLLSNQTRDYSNLDLLEVLCRKLNECLVLYSIKLKNIHIK
jgi:hypothetical protein